MVYPKRKHPRLKDYDYSQPGFYYVTIHTAEGAAKLSVIRRGKTEEAELQLSPAGKMAEKQLLNLQMRFPHVTVHKYVIMPNHIHIILQLTEDTAGASPRPTLMDVIGVYKSLTTRKWNHVQATPGKKLFQTSFYETVLRNEQAYRECWRYVDENPAKWMLEQKKRC